MTFATLPAQWSIASCLFPYEENPTVPGPGPHPVLIAGVLREKGLVLAAYGTGQSSIALAGKDLQPHQIEIAPNGRNYLKYVTRFDFRRAVPLPWNSAWFKPIAPYVPVIMGNLDRTQIIQANAALQATRNLLSSGAIAPWGSAPLQAAPAQSTMSNVKEPVMVIYRKRRNVSSLGDNDDLPQ